MREALFSFDTTHMALWAEEVAREREIPAEVVPAPPELEAKCGLALATLPDRVDGLIRALRESGVAFHPPAPSAGGDEKA